MRAPEHPVSAAAAASQSAASLGGTGWLADDLYLIAHDDVTGRLRLQPLGAGLGLAGALLAELLLAGLIAVRPGTVTAAPGPQPGDQLARRVLAQVTAERGRHGLGDWLRYLSGTAAADVAGRLGRAGYLSQVPARWPRRSTRWVPADRDCAFAAIARGRAALDPARPAEAARVVLAGLAGACGLGPLLMQYAAAGACGPEDAAAALPLPLRYLVAQTRAAVDSAVLARRM
jgi:Golgi phosphoprotein 3 (GPP34)